MDLLEVFTRLSIAALLGGALGLEREYRDKDAGFRTMILIALGAALFTVAAFEIGSDLGQYVDPTRIISYVVAGVGFLGAGVIAKDGLSIKGLTTASTIWVSAALGVMSGSGMFLNATVAAAIGLFTLLVLPYFERRIDYRKKTHKYEISCKSQAGIDKVLRDFKASKIRIFEYTRSKKRDYYKISLSTEGTMTAHAALENKLIADPEIIEF